MNLYQCSLTVKGILKAKSLKYLSFGPIFIHHEKGKGDVNVIAKGSL